MEKERLIVAASLFCAFLLSLSMLKCLFHLDKTDDPVIESQEPVDIFESQTLYRTFKYHNVIQFTHGPANTQTNRTLGISELETANDWQVYLANLKQSPEQEKFGLTDCEVKHLHRSVQEREKRFKERKPAPVEFPMECGACKLGVGLLQTLISQHKTKVEITSKLISFCTILKIEDNRVCAGVVSLFQTEVLYVFEQLALDPSQVCGFFLGDDCSDVYNPFDDWNVTLPITPKPPVVPPKPPQPGAPKLRVLQLADIHLDFEYTPGTNADCGEPVCCRKDDGPVIEKAGRWGSYLDCDTPVETFEHMLQHIAENEKIDYIMWLGDLPGHNVWSQTREEQLHALKYLTDTLVKFFPNTTVYSALGNHESTPVNSFPPPFINGNMSVSWLYDALVKNWTTWLPDSTVYTIEWGAYYTVAVQPGFRIISLNMNYCNNQNWWLLLNTTDPAEELQWLMNVLQSAEDNHEKVHIIGHIPAGHTNCVKKWSHNYYEIISRYEATIAAQFFGHTHHDSFTVFYDEDDLKRPVSTAYIGPSVTPYQGLNPGYRIYEFDGFYPNSTWALLDHINYIANLSEANRPGHSPEWKKEYSAKEIYNMTSLFPSDWDKVYHKLKEDQSLFDTYHKYFYKSNPPATPCDEKCRKSMLCSIERGRSHDPSLCQDLNMTTVETGHGPDWCQES